MARSTRRAFTLIEILVVVAIIALLIAILIPSLAMARDQAASTVCKTRQRELYMGHVYYSNDFKDFFPNYEWWAWDCHHTSWYPNETLATYTNGHVYDKSGGTWWADSSRWPEYGQIYKYVKNKETYFCPKDKMRRKGVAIGSGAPDCGSKPITSYTHVLEVHDLALAADTGGARYVTQALDYAPSDFLSPARFKSKAMAKLAPGYLGGAYATKGFSMTPDRVALLFEEWPNGEGTDTLGKHDGSSDYVSMDNAVSYPVLLTDYIAMRHMERGNAIYWDGHAATSRKGAEPNYHPNCYLGQFLLGAGTVDH
jgi:prepilin-type N-terminal cleavage/methylation domain-containing protein/prepilin-type processing-associated H-X9-DG protein